MMDISENIRMAIESLRANRMRTLLTMLGIIIGITSVIAVMTVGEGLAGSVNESMEAFGSANISVYLESREKRSDYYYTVEPMDSDLITDDMCASLREAFQGRIKYISGSQGVGGGKAQLGRKQANIRLRGITPDALYTSNEDVIYGRGIQDGDLLGMRNVAVVSDIVVENLYDGKWEKAMGQEMDVTMDNRMYSFTIVGEYEYKPNFLDGDMGATSRKDTSTNVYIPVTTARRYMSSNSAKEGFSNITVTGMETEDPDDFKDDVTDYLNRYYVNNPTWCIEAETNKSAIDQVSTIMSSIEIGISFIAGISLLVGGIGVMNIMLVSVTERTREIGTRKALGATNSAIRLQFIVESIIVCLIGGVIGMILGGTVGYIASRIVGSATMPGLFSIILAFGFSMLIGVFFGYYPANKAAQLDPIEALRYE